MNDINNFLSQSTINYKPNIFKKDIYSLGTLIYEIAYGINPVTLTNEENMKVNNQTGVRENPLEIILEKEKTCKFNIPDNIKILKISKILQDFIYRLLSYNEEDRPSIEQVKKHMFITTEIKNFPEEVFSKDEEDYHVFIFKNKQSVINKKVCLVQKNKISCRFEIKNNLLLGYEPESANAINKEYVFYSRSNIKANFAEDKFVIVNIAITNDGIYIYIYLKNNQIIIKQKFKFDEIHYFNICMDDNQGEIMLNCSTSIDDPIFLFEKNQYYILKEIAEIFYNCYKVKTGKNIDVIQCTKKDFIKRRTLKKTKATKEVDLSKLELKNEQLLNYEQLMKVITVITGKK